MRELLDGTPQLQALFNTEPWPGYHGTSIGALTGQHYKVANRRELFEQTLLTVLAKPITFEAIIDGCAADIESKDCTKWFVRPFGITASSQAVAGKLAPKVKAEVVYDASFGLSEGRPTTTSKAPIAIVGMAGRFPGAASHDALWDLLQKGIDCHKVVSLRHDVIS